MAKGVPGGSGPEQVMVHKALLGATAGEEGGIRKRAGGSQGPSEVMITGEDLAAGLGREEGGRRRGAERSDPRPERRIVEGQHLFVFVHGFQVGSPQPRGFLSLAPKGGDRSASGRLNVCCASSLCPGEPIRPADDQECSGRRIPAG